MMATESPRAVSSQSFRVQILGFRVCVVLNRENLNPKLDTKSYLEVHCYV